MMLKRDSTVLQREGRKLIGILSNGQKKMGEWEAWNKRMGEEKKIQKQIKKRMGHKTSKKSIKYKYKNSWI